MKMRRIVRERQTVRMRLERRYCLTVGYNISLFVLYEAQSSDLCERYDILLVMQEQIHRVCDISLTDEHFGEPRLRSSPTAARMRRKQAILILEQLDTLDRSSEGMDMNF